MKRWIPFSILSLCFHAFLLSLPLTFPERAAPGPAPIVLDLEAGSPPKRMSRPEAPEKTAAPAAAAPSHSKETQAVRKPRQDSSSKSAALSPGMVSPPTPPRGAELNNPGDALQDPMPSPQGEAASIPNGNLPQGGEPGGRQLRMAVPADILTRFQPVYPLASRRRGEQGEARLLVRLGPDGDILSVEVAASSGYPLLDASALAAVKRWVFSPRTPKELIVPVIFRLE